ncbi:conserved hypothetical protein [Gammaproteobacteria bacterium]
MNMKLSIIFPMLFLITSCATQSYGDRIALDESALARIHAGKSTATDLRRQLGQPTEVESISPGEENWIYRYIEYTGTYLPVFGKISTGGGEESVVKFCIRDNQVDRIERSHTKRTAGF